LPHLQVVFVKAIPKRYLTYQWGYALTVSILFWSTAAGFGIEQVKKNNDDRY
jgi:hypothetical protein